ncbi:hypothetical protein IAT40_007531 [Kwoniella sp. CBS 6097]
MSVPSTTAPFTPGLGESPLPFLPSALTDLSEIEDAEDNRLLDHLSSGYRTGNTDLQTQFEQVRKARDLVAESQRIHVPLDFENAAVNNHETECSLLYDYYAEKLDWPPRKAQADSDARVAATNAWRTRKGTASEASGSTQAPSASDVGGETATAGTQNTTITE